MKNYIPEINEVLKSYDYDSKKLINMLQRIQEKIDGRYIPEDVAEYIAKELNISKYHFLRLFKDKTFLSPHAYLMSTRIEKAKFALQDGQSLIETAYGCGFNDQSHLNRRFKGVFGLTPKEYQNFFL